MSCPYDNFTHAVYYSFLIICLFIYFYLCLQDQISKLNGRLKLCNLLDSIDVYNLSPQDVFVDNLPSNSLKIAALAVPIMLLSLPLFFFKYVDYVSNSRRLLDNNTEEVSLNKQLAYRVDVFLSVTPYSKPLALLVATLLLICLGGLALFGVTDDGLADSLWLSWTYIADSGNHANSEGIGPRLVSVSISFGGMLIFAMMLGLVSDAISEKFDSLRKGRSEVVERNHTLILGWSDKLVRPYVVCFETGCEIESPAFILHPLNYSTLGMSFIHLKAPLSLSPFILTLYKNAISTDIYAISRDHY